jgi:hypothetical protein
MAHGASLADSKRLFNAGLGGKVWRSVDLYEGDKIDTKALKELVILAIEHNQSKAKKPPKRRSIE